MAGNSRSNAFSSFLAKAFAEQIAKEGNSKRPTRVYSVKPSESGEITLSVLTGADSSLVHIERGKKILGRVGIRMRDGRFQRSTTLRNVIQAMLAEQVRANMGRLVKEDGRPAFKNDTGRFANTVELNDIYLDPENMEVSLYFSYMNAPYDSFNDNTSYTDKTHDSNLANRLKKEYANPQTLASVSILQAARDILHSNYTFITKEV